MLMFGVVKARFPSCSESGRELIRMYELQTCEISLLWRPDSAVWSAASSVRAMSSHVDDPREKARSSGVPHASVRPPSSTGRRPRAFTALFQATGRGITGVSVSLPPSAASVCFPTCSTEDPARVLGATCRWSLVPVQRGALGPLLNGPQTVPWQLRNLPRPGATPRQGGRFTLAEGCGGYPAKRYAPRSSHGRG